MAVVLAQGWLCALMAFVIVLLALREFYGLLEAQGYKIFSVAGMISAVAFLGGSFYFLRFHPGAEASFEVFLFAGALMVFFVNQMRFPIEEKIPLESIAYTMFGLLYIPWLFNFVTKIVFIELPDASGNLVGISYTVFLLVATKFGDMGAYVFGSLFGRHKLIPHVSPGKTWEGFAGALASSLMGGLAVYAFYGPERMPALHNWWIVGILSLVLSVVSVAGDLAESVIKRSTLSKDSGHVLPGIGGTMDLIDSLLFTAPLLYLYLCLATS